MDAAQRRAVTLEARRASRAAMLGPSGHLVATSTSRPYDEAFLYLEILVRPISTLDFMTTLSP